MKKNTFSKKKLERGQSLVELALSLTVILLLLSGAVTFGMAYFSFLSINDAAQEGATYGSLKPDDQAGIRNRVREASNNPIDLTLLTDSQIPLSYNNSKECQGFTGGVANTLTVSVNYSYQVFMPFIGPVIGSNTIPLSATTTVVILTPQCP